MSGLLTHVLSPGRTCVLPVNAEFITLQDFMPGGANCVRTIRAVAVATATADLIQLIESLYTMK